MRVFTSCGTYLKMMRTEVIFQGRHSFSSTSLNSQVVGVFLVTHEV